MIREILLIVGVALMILSYLLILVSYLRATSKKSRQTAQELALAILNDETNINLIETKNSYFSTYNLRRRMVKLSSTTYNSDNYFKLAIASFLAYFSLNNHKYCQLLSKLFTNLRWISFSPIVVIIVSAFSQNIGDAKLGLIILVLVAIYQYLLNTIYTESLEGKIIEAPIKKVLNTFVLTSKIFFVVTLLEIMREVIIIFNLL